MPKTIKFKSLHLISYTVHDEITVNYGDITRLSGQNGEGKSSIGEAPVWIMYGTDLLGGTFDPSPTDRPFERVYGALTITVDGEEHTITREIVNGEKCYSIDGNSRKFKEFEAFVSSLFAKDDFLSLYYPQFFFNRHWKEQRAQVMKNVVAPPNSDVFREMSRTSPEQTAKDIILNPQAVKLSELLKKSKIEDLHKNNTEKKKKMTTEHPKAQGSVSTLTVQLKSLGERKIIDRPALEAEGEELDKKIQSYESDKAAVVQWQNQRSRLQMQIDQLAQRIADGRAEHSKTSSTEITTKCGECGQELTDEAKATSQGKKKKVVKDIAIRVNDMLKQKKALVDQMEALPVMEGPDYSIADLIGRIGEINSLLQSDNVYAKAVSDLEKAKAHEAECLRSKNESIFIIDAINAFVAKEAEIQVHKVDEMFTTLTVRLLNYVKTDDRYDPFFTFQMNGKDYEKLSVGEKISAGLELSEVLYKQSELVVPTFVDGIGEYTGEYRVYGQLITAQAVKGQKLKIESEEL